MSKNRTPSSETLWRLATNLKRLRKARGLTQMALARRSEVPNRYISNIEQGLKNVCLANLEALAQGLECGIEDLVMKPPIRQVDQELVSAFAGVLGSSLNGVVASPSYQDADARVTVGNCKSAFVNNGDIPPASALEKSTTVR